MQGRRGFRDEPWCHPGGPAYASLHLPVPPQSQGRVQMATALVHAPSVRTWCCGCPSLILDPHPMPTPVSSPSPPDPCPVRATTKGRFWGASALPSVRHTPPDSAQFQRKQSHLGPVTGVMGGLNTSTTCAAPTAEQPSRRRAVRA